MSNPPAAKTRMTQAEYRALPETNQHMELINGELIVSPTPIHAHQKSVFKLAKLIERLAPGGEVIISPMDVYIGKDTVQPDVFWISGAESPCKLGEDGYWYGAPDLVVEVLSPSTEYRDRDAKFKLYEKHGVREYWLVNAEAKFIEVYRLEAGKFVQYGIFSMEQQFTSDVLNGQTVEVKAIFG